MYRCMLKGVEKPHQYEELIKVFLRPEEYLISDDPEEVCVHTYGFKGDKDELKRQLYRDLESYTGKSPKWGILTGIRPVKKAGEMLRAYGSTDEVRKIFEKDYMIHPSKSSLVTEILGYQLEHAGRPGKKSLSVDRDTFLPYKMPVLLIHIQPEALRGDRALSRCAGG